MMSGGPPILACDPLHMVGPLPASSSTRSYTHHCPSAAVAFLLLLSLPPSSSCLKLCFQFFTSLSSESLSLANKCNSLGYPESPSISSLSYFHISSITIFDITGLIHSYYLPFPSHPVWASLIAQMVKNLPAMLETPV